MNHIIAALVGIVVCSGSCALADDELIAWGQPNHGLTSHLDITGRQFAAGKAIPFSYVIRNLADKPTRIWHSGFWLNHQLRVCDQNGALVALSPYGKQRFGVFSPGGERNKNVPVDIKASGEDAYGADMEDITRLYDLTHPGVYSVKMLYEEYHGGWEGQLWSNVTIIDLIPQPKLNVPVPIGHDVIDRIQNK